MAIHRPLQNAERSHPPSSIEQRQLGCVICQPNIASPHAIVWLEHLWKQCNAVTAQHSIRAFSSEVDTGSREENASTQESRAPFRFHRNGKGSKATVKSTNRTVTVSALRNSLRLVRCHRGVGLNIGPRSMTFCNMPLVT